jgi:hypothetical protein
MSTSYLCLIPSCVEKGVFSCTEATFNVGNTTETCWGDGNVITDISWTNNTHHCKYAYWFGGDRYLSVGSNNNSVLYFSRDDYCPQQGEVAGPDPNVIWFGVALAVIYGAMIFMALYEVYANGKTLDINRSNVMHKYKKYKNSLLFIYPSLAYTLYNSALTVSYVDNSVASFLSIVQFFPLAGIIFMTILGQRRLPLDPLLETQVNLRISIDVMNDIMTSINILFILALYDCAQYKNDDDAQYFWSCDQEIQDTWKGIVVFNLAKMAFAFVMLVAGVDKRFKCYVKGILFCILMMIGYLIVSIEDIFCACCKDHKYGTKFLEKVVIWLDPVKEMREQWEDKKEANEKYVELFVFF